MDDLVTRLSGAVVGRRRELELVVAALQADRHIVLEGPPGTGKSTLLRAVAHELGIGFEFVDSSATSIRRGCSPMATWPTCSCPGRSSRR